MTFGPGRQVWERFGHNAIWIHDPVHGTDEAYNYGLFDFAQEITSILEHLSLAFIIIWVGRGWFARIRNIRRQQIVRIKSRIDGQQAPGTGGEPAQGFAE